VQARYTVTDNGSVVADVTITDDGKVVVTTGGTQVKPGEEVDVAGSGGAVPSGAAQYVWGATNVAERAGSIPSARLESPGDSGLKSELTTGERIVGAGLRGE
jgi:hypothetical protein